MWSPAGSHEVAGRGGEDLRVACGGALMCSVECHAGLSRWRCAQRRWRAAASGVPRRAAALVPEAPPALWWSGVVRATCSLVGVVPRTGGHKASVVKRKIIDARPRGVCAPTRPAAASGGVDDDHLSRISPGGWR